MKLQISSYPEKELRLPLAGGAPNSLPANGISLALVQALEFRLSSLIAFVIGIFPSCLFNAKIVFSIPLSWKSFFAYPTVYIVHISLSLIGMQILVRLLHFSPTFASPFNPLLIVPITFALSSQIVVNTSSDKDSRDDQMMAICWSDHQQGTSSCSSQS